MRKKQPILPSKFSVACAGMAIGMLIGFQLATLGKCSFPEGDNGVVPIHEAYHGEGILVGSISSRSSSNYTSKALGKKAGEVDDDFALACEESYGFFTDISSEAWQRKREIAAQTPHHLQMTEFAEADLNSPRGWFQNNWEPDFSCSFEQFIGPIRDGHKWVCDPHRLVAQKSCLVYSFGSNGNTDFEGGIRAIADHCEIHIFDPGDFGGQVREDLPGAHYHHYGLKPNYVTPSTNLKLRGGGLDPRFEEPPPGHYKTLKEVVAELGHQGRTVDLFKIDIEGAEWTTFRDWQMAGVRLRQILVEVHGAPPIANDLFATLHEAGYVLFHKEPNTESAGGDCVEFSFLKLRPSFFLGGGAHQPTEEAWVP